LKRPAYQEALKILETEPIDAVVADLQMPRFPAWSYCPTSEGATRMWCL
jgi:CheY-like chemotaxis protein